MQCYLLLIKGSFAEWHALSEEKRNEIVKQFGNYAKFLDSKGYMLGGDGCSDRSFRILNPQQSAEQSLVAPETRDMVTGYFLINVPSEDEALKVAKECPAFNCGEYVELVPCGGH